MNALHFKQEVIFAIEIEKEGTSGKFQEVKVLQEAHNSVTPIIEEVLTSSLPNVLDSMYGINVKLAFRGLLPGVPDRNNIEYELNYYFSAIISDVEVLALRENGSFTIAGVITAETSSIVRVKMQSLSDKYRVTTRVMFVKVFEDILSIPAKRKKSAVAQHQDRLLIILAVLCLIELAIITLLVFNPVVRTYFNS